MRSVSYAAIYNRCYPMKRRMFAVIVKRQISPRRSLRTRYNWSKHVTTMIQTSNPQLRFSCPSLPSWLHSHVARCHRLNELAVLQAVRKLQRAVARWVWRPGGPYFMKYLHWDVFTSRPGEGGVWGAGTPSTGCGGGEGVSWQHAGLPTR